MCSRLSRRIVIAAALAALAGSIGCGPPGARTFAVVLREPPELECYPEQTSPDVNLEDFFYVLTQLPAAWAVQFDSGQLRPTGGTLHLTEEGTHSLAWFEGLQQNPYYQWNGVVFEGEGHDDYVEASNVFSHDPDLADPLNLYPDCGPLTDVESVLLATLDGASIEGRIRRTEYTYFSASDSLCAAYISCGRSISVTGAEEP